MAYIKSFWSTVAGFFVALFVFFAGRSEVSAVPFDGSGPSDSTDDVGAPSVGVPVNVDLGDVGDVGDVGGDSATSGAGEGSPVPGQAPNFQGDPVGADSDKAGEGDGTGDGDAPEPEDDKGSLEQEEGSEAPESEADGDESEADGDESGKDIEDDENAEDAAEVERKKAEAERKRREEQLARESQMLQKALSGDGDNAENKGCLSLISVFVIGVCGTVSTISSYLV